jgi:hypothetical protein
MHIGQQVHGYECGVSEIHVVHILCCEPDQRFHAFAFRVRSRFLNPLRIYINANAARPVPFCGSDDDAAVAATEVINYIALPGTRKL